MKTLNVFVYHVKGGTKTMFKKNVMVSFFLYRSMAHVVTLTYIGHHLHKNGHDRCPLDGQSKKPGVLHPHELLTEIWAAIVMKAKTVRRTIFQITLKELDCFFRIYHLCSASLLHIVLHWLGASASFV